MGVDPNFLLVGPHVLWGILVFVLVVVAFFVGGRWEKHLAAKEAAAVAAGQKNLTELKNHVTAVANQTMNTLGQHITSEVQKATDAITGKKAAAPNAKA